VGAELFGHAGVQSDIEVMELMLATIDRIGLRDTTLILGHVGIYRALVQILSLSEEQQQQAQAMLERKSLPEWQAFCAEIPDTAPIWVDFFQALPRLCGSANDVLQQAKALMRSRHHPAIEAALSRLKMIIKHLLLTHPSLSIHLDLSDLRGFDYHTGVVFGVVEAKRQRLIAAGGRYDDSGEVFGVTRPATGFSLDLRQLMDLSLPMQPPKRKRILAPAVADLSLVAKIQQFRQEGHRVIIGFPDLDWQSQRQHCDVELLQEQGQWVLRAV
jgi:ATP phosphoribosyltransferase regulatory subunit